MSDVATRCKSCGLGFLLPIELGSKQTFDSMGFVNNTVQCSLCGRSNVYSKEDLTFVDHPKEPAR
jgi:hypothetical protein